MHLQQETGIDGPAYSPEESRTGRRRLEHLPPEQTDLELSAPDLPILPISAVPEPGTPDASELVESPAAAAVSVSAPVEPPEQPEIQPERQDARPPALAEVSDAWLVGRARELTATAQSSDLEAQLSMAREADDLLTEAQRRGEPRMVAQILRASVIVRLVTPGLGELTDPLLEELLSHTGRHGLIVLQADAHALAGRRALMSGYEDTALSEVAAALVMLEGDPVPDVLFGGRTWARLLAAAWVDIGLVLTQLGVYELADEVLARANLCVRENGGPHEIAVHMINRVRLLLGWGLRLERVGKGEEAVDRFATASALAVSVEGPWRESLFPRRSDRPAAVQVPMLGAAHALARPSTEHIERLEELLTLSMYPREQIVTAIALSRCLELAGRDEQAQRVLGDTRVQLARDTSEPTLMLCLVREYARLCGPDGGRETSNALEAYATALEHELWTLREARVATLLTRLEHERLSREHGAIAQQALQDPLTGLPNRRALDERMDTLVATPSAYPLSVALVDLDGFKSVNDRCSHAEGDDVLRVIASTLRDALRGDDLVGRYGGDEFVVLLPGAPLGAAEAALSRAVEAVSRLPVDFSRGVTLSIGVVSVRPAETPGQALARADAAMYQAKRQGGCRVAVSGADTADDLPHSSSWVPPPCP
ncbi:GGDEF domain-containing protein [Allokutzneria sp. NRRL B-24872]|uniref:sensor domain-containing diguanylate cyclase n=1 Tax=Allokutzneria sp. NRRL B-24872 TaxID=1137961 RepID=UPI000A38AB9B|nr:GGDEF domain-containing protein [Allokutzneria sp. NRRL B-24872]